MKKLTSLGVAAFAALVSVLAILGAQTPAQAYPDARINLEVNRSQLYGGEKFTATASSDGTTCSWRLEWNGDTRHGASSEKHRFMTTYTAPEVNEVTRIPLHGTCMYTSPSAHGAATWQHTIMITVLPRSSAVEPPRASSDLPNSGGPNTVFLAGGLALLLSGAIAVTVARRRAEDAEIQGSRA